MHDTTGQETKLLHLLSQGDETAFRSLFETYHHFIYTFAYRMTGSVPIAKDVVQDVFIKLWLNRQELPLVQNLPAYINRLTRNHVLNGIKRKALEEGLLKDLGAQADDRRYDPEEQAHSRELEMLLEKAVSQLPARQQRVYRMSRTEGLRHGEIAEQLNISKETVKKHIMAALASVRQYLAENGRVLGLIAVLMDRYIR